MKLKKWFSRRGPAFIIQRGTSVMKRYDVTPARAMKRIEHSVQALSDAGCSPTYLVPGNVIEQHPDFFRRLQAGGVELGVHSYHHVDLSALSLPEARVQLDRALATLERHGLEARGFRCPYLGWSEELRDSLPHGMFEYSSNEAVYCGPQPDRGVPRIGAKHSSPKAGDGKRDFFSTLEHFYKGKLLSENVSAPATRANLVEIPVSVPDDLQLHDGLRLGPDEMTEVWSHMLDEVYGRGEMLTILFHLELAAHCEPALLSLVSQAKAFKMPVWIARLRDISDWWREKATFGVEESAIPSGACLSFACSPRATILARGMDGCVRGPAWDDGYVQVQSRSLDLPAGLRPFVGVPSSAAESAVAFLGEQGYIVERTDDPERCATYVDKATLEGSTEVALVRHIESAGGPLVKYGRWPNGAKAVLSLTGDLDALTLMDYARRPFER
jgi:peptidoglycan/xylan/chitin deacetylase (PgdA/CDA1 family)